MKPEEQSLLAKMLGYAGETLDKPGRFFRGLGSTGLHAATLGYYGQPDPRAMLNIVPFSDTFGLTDPNAEKHARELYAPAGYNAPNDGTIGSSLGDAAVDIVTDPSTYFTFGVVPALKYAAKGISAAPKALGITSKVAKVAPEVMDAAKVAPDIMNAASKAPSVVSTSARELPSVIPANSFDSMADIGLDVLKNELSQVSPKIKSRNPLNRKVVYTEAFPLNSVSANTIQNGIEAFPTTIKTADSFAPQTEKTFKDLVQKDLPFNVPVSSTSAAIEQMDPSFLKIINDVPFGSPQKTARGFDYTMDIGKVKPLSETIGTFVTNTSDDAIRAFDYANDLAKVNPATSTVGGTFADVAAPIVDNVATKRTWGGLFGDGYNYAADKFSKIPDIGKKTIAVQLDNFGKVDDLGKAVPVFSDNTDRIVRSIPKFLTNVIPNRENVDNSFGGSVQFGSPEERKKRYLDKLNSDDF